jgi:putative flippase GtrA
MTTTKVPFKKSFYRSQVVSFGSSVVDYLVFFITKELLGVYYPIASALGNIIGALVNFMLGRHWSFKRADGKVTNQAIKYTLVSFSSAVLNTYGIYFIVEYFHIHENYAKIIISIFVGVFWNFPLFRYFVFK